MHVPRRMIPAFLADRRRRGRPSPTGPATSLFTRHILAVPLALAVMVGGAAAWAATGGPPSAATQEAGMTAGGPFQDPPDLNAPSPHVTITLNAADTWFDLSGRRVFGQSYDGSFVAPTIHLMPGGTADITLVNHLPVATNLHFHGLHVAPSDHADDTFLCVAPGDTLVYHLHLPTDQPVGTFWYHSHAMGTTCTSPGGYDMPGMAAPVPATPAAPGGPPAAASAVAATPTPSASATYTPGDTENQIFAGLSGALIVGDDRTLLPPALQHITAHTLVFKDVQIDGADHIVQNNGAESINSNSPTVRLVNGQLRPDLTMRPGETQLWRLVNAGADIFYQLHLDGYHFTVIGQDGRPTAQVTTADTLLLPPAKRYDVLVTAGMTTGDAGQTWLRTTAYSNGPQGDSYPDVTLVHVRVAGWPAPPLPAPAGAVPTAAPSLADAPIAQHRTVALSEDPTGTVFYVNGVQFAMGNASIFSTPAKLGTVEEWTITNTSGETHPFHLHTNAFQVMSVNGVPQPYTGRQDIVPVPHAVNGVPGQVVIRIPFTDFTGQWMFHCHIAAHEDNGMMSYIDVVP